MCEGAIRELATDGRHLPSAYSECLLISNSLRSRMASFASQEAFKCGPTELYVVEHSLGRCLSCEANNAPGCDDVDQHLSGREID